MTEEWYMDHAYTILLATCKDIRLGSYCTCVCFISDATCTIDRCIISVGLIEATHITSSVSSS